VIRLEPPDMGRIDITIRQSAGALHVNLSASNGEVLRQLNSVGDAVRQDLSQRQASSDVTVTVTAARTQADADGRQRQQREQQDEQRTPGRALSEDGAQGSTFAMLTERE